MNKELVEILVGFHRILDALRLRKNSDCNVESLKNATEISRATADRQVNDLVKKGIISKTGRHLAINSHLAYFLGISVGSQHTRVHFIDLAFNNISIESLPFQADIKAAGEIEQDECSENGFCFKTISENIGFISNPFDKVHTLISHIVSVFLNQTEYPLAGIGIAVTGPVDYAEANWRSAPEHFTRIQNISLQELIGYGNFEKAQELGVFLSFDNNAKTAMISEYQYLLEQNQGNFCEDIALLYIGSGIGSSAVLGKTLLRGSHNLSGEVGSLPAPFYNTGAISGGLQKTIDEQLRQLRLPNTEEESSEAWQQYYSILTYLCNVITCILGIDRIILVGHSIRQHECMIPGLLKKRMEYTVAATQHYCRPEKGRGDSGTAAIGAAIEAYMSMCHYDKELPNARINLAKTISWL